MRLIDGFGARDSVMPNTADDNELLPEMAQQLALWSEPDRELRARLGGRPKDAAAWKLRVEPPRWTARWDELPKCDHDEMLDYIAPQSSCDRTGELWLLG